MTKQYHFARPALAAEIASIIAGPNPLNLSGDGLFIGGERRIGKTAFLTQDLTPALERLGVEVIYLDLMQSKMPPDEMIAGAFSRLNDAWLESKKSTLKKLKPAGVNAAVLGVGAGISFHKRDEKDSMLESFYALHEKIKKPIALIIDEAQRALDTDQGRAALWALKSARDQIKNNPRTQAKLILVFTGSNQAKLSDMVSKKSEAFFGSTITPMPNLDYAYVENLCSTINSMLLKELLNPKVIFPLFEVARWRPAVLASAITNSILSSDPNSTLTQRVKAAIKVQADQEIAQFKEQFDGLPPLAKLVLQDMADPKDIAPVFSTTNVKKYSVALKKKTITTASIQAAIDLLIKAGIVWRSNRGVYKLEEPEKVASFFKAWVLAPLGKNTK
jgi:methylmalonyl-CoA mutase cobalamin-binding subunit